MGKYGMILKQQ